MNKSQRKLLRTTGFMGLLLTALVVVLDQFEALTAGEHFLSDRRARYCQIFAPDPTDLIEHVDIDNGALNSLGGWPWPRHILARIVDELNGAGAKVVAFDVMFLEPDNNPPPEGAKIVTGKSSYNDQTFAAALQRSNKALLPLSLTFQKYGPRNALYDSITGELEQDLELTPKEIAEILENRGHQRIEQDKIDKEFVRAREQAMMNRLLRDRHLTEEAFSQLRSRLLPKSGTLAGSPVLRLLQKKYPEALSIREVEGKGRPVPPGFPPPLVAESVQTPIPVLTEAAGYYGFVDYIRNEDGVVRQVPLWSEYNRRLYPQFGFALACAMLNVDVTNPEQVELTGQQIILRPPNHAAVVIPVNTLRSRDYGGVAMLMDIPWIGTHGWMSMYGLDSLQRPRHHLPIGKVWEICEKKEAIVTNYRSIDKAILYLLDHTNPRRAAAYRAHPPPPGDSPQRTAIIQFVRTNKGVLDLLRDYRDSLAMPHGAQKPEDEKSRQTIEDFVKAYDALPLIQQEIQGLIRDLDSATKYVRHEVVGRAALIGWTASGALDNVPTPVEPNCPGVVAHGTVFNAIMEGRLQRRAPLWGTCLVTVILGLMTTAAVTLMSPWPALGTTAAMTASYLAINGLLLYDKHNIILGLAGPVSATAIVWSGSTLFRYILERAERTRITQRFRTYVDPGLVNYVTETEKERLDGEKRECTIIFTDLQGFTGLTERLGEGAVHVLGEYMGEMVPAIRACRGYVNKFIGDGIMCLFNALEPNPDHAGDAMAAVVQMNRALASFNERLKARNLPTLVMRAGVNTGTVIVGDAGPPHIASDYTALGDGVNVASRLESANKLVGTCTMIGARTAELLNGRYLLRPIGKLCVMGKTEPVMTYEPLAPSEHASDEQKRIVEATSRVVELFQARRFAECIEAIQCAEKCLGSKSKLFEVYKTLSERYQIQCPDDFRGEIVLEEK